MLLSSPWSSCAVVAVSTITYARQRQQAGKPKQTRRRPRRLQAICSREYANTSTVVSARLVIFQDKQRCWASKMRRRAGGKTSISCRYQSLRGISHSYNEQPRLDTNTSRAHNKHVEPRDKTTVCHMRSNCMLGHHVGHMLPGDRTEVDLTPEWTRARKRQRTRQDGSRDAGKIRKHPAGRRRPRRGALIGAHRRKVVTPVPENASF